ncbi:hypothetical protein FQR65_LT05783 [Abscondita terminalis]|nr:hypothetical protein FQR65_LT05783 [Abscondita terminalis]
MRRRTKDGEQPTHEDDNVHVHADDRGPKIATVVTRDDGSQAEERAGDNGKRDTSGIVTQAITVCRLLGSLETRNEGRQTNATPTTTTRGEWTKQYKIAFSVG